MVRALRIEYAGAYYHVMSRGYGRRSVFPGDQCKEQFLSCLEQAHRRFALECHGYCLMGSHYHLLVRTPRGNLSRAMRHVNGVYTQYYNSLKKTEGPLFRGRYKAINIEASSHLLEVSRYIHRNPLETKKPLPECLESYRWSSYPAYRKKADSPDWLYKDSVLDALGSARPIAAYRRFVEQGNDEDTEKFYTKKHWPAARGSKKFVEKALSRSSAQGRRGGREPKVISAQKILSVVAKRMDCSRKDLLITKRGSGVDNTGRAIAMRLCQECGGMKLTEMAELFGVGSDSAISRAISRLSESLSADRKLEKLYDDLYQELNS